jgi:iron complex outermembrane receptor protein
MKIRMLLLALAAINVISAYSQTTLSGFIYDKGTHTPLPGAAVYIPDLKTGAASDTSGLYKLSHLPKQKFLVQVSFVGYTTLIETIDLSVVTEINFLLEPASIEGHEVVITGNPFATDADRSSVSVTQIQKKELTSLPYTNVIDAIAHTPGVSQVTTGGAISKPVIRGLGYNRIVVLNEGVRQEGQQWGDEHGIEIDEHTAERIEVLRGPSSLMYGSDAMGGVINFLEPLPPVMNTWSGEFVNRLSTNEKLYSSSLMFEGNYNGLAMRVRGSRKSAGAYSTPVETVYNSQYSETDFSGWAGINRKWGYSRIFFSSYSAWIGLVEGERDNITEKFIDANGNIVTEDVLDNRDPGLPFQLVGHRKISSQSRLVTKYGQFQVNAGYQDNQRREFEETKEEPAIFMNLHTGTLDIKYHLPERRGWEQAIGISGLAQSNSNLGEEFIIPGYALLDAGAFLFTRKGWEKGTVSLGIRYDHRSINAYRLVLDSLGSPDENGGDTLFNSFNRIFSAFTGSAGITRKVNAVNLKFNIGRGFRAPNLSELSANGVHEGTFRYEIGNPGLKPEYSLQLDAGIKYDTKNICAEINVFRNQIDNFIYYRNVNGEMINDGSDSFLVFRYTQGKALLQGFEFTIDAHFFSHLHFENSISFVKATNEDTGIPLPFIPPVLVHNELKWEIHRLEGKILKEPFLKFGVDNHLRQSRTDLFETATAGYSLLNGAIGTELKIGKEKITFSLIVSNLTNRKYYDHLNRLKYAGVYNKGRTFLVYAAWEFGKK